MKPESSDHLAKARELLREYQGVAMARFDNPTGHCAYGAALHAAQAIIFERTGKTVPSHKGVNIEFAKITEDETGIDKEFHSILSQTYNLKTIADYELGPGSSIPVAKALKAITWGDAIC